MLRFNYRLWPIKKLTAVLYIWCVLWTVVIYCLIKITRLNVFFTNYLAFIVKICIFGLVLSIFFISSIYFFILIWWKLSQCKSLLLLWWVHHILSASQSIIPWGSSPETTFQTRSGLLTMKTPPLHLPQCSSGFLFDILLSCVSHTYFIEDSARGKWQ